MNSNSKDTQKKKIKWTRLDNASKIFPATCNNKDTKVFRLSCELYESVDPDILQDALNITMESFPMFQSVLRRGLFWYYFEGSDVMPVVEEENESLCAPVYIKDKKTLLLRVSYYNKRINVEMFHALTDGSGVIWFTETLIHHYITLKNDPSLSSGMPELNFKASISQKMADSFAKNYKKRNVNPSKQNKNKSILNAYHIAGTRIDENRTKLVEGTMSVKEILNLAHEHNTTLTIFLTSLYLYSIYMEMPSKAVKKPVVLSVPINLRPYFNSNTARNFFGTMNISYDFSKYSAELNDIIQIVNDSFKKELTMEKLENHLYKLMALEKNPFARIIPLTLKDYTLKIANYVKDLGLTSSISNIGRINMPNEFKSFINKFIISVSARRPQVLICSYEDNLVISFVSPFHDTDIQRNFFQFLSSKGVNIQISTNI